MAGVEHFELRLHAQFLDALGAGAQLLRRRHVDEVAVAEIERAAIKRADFRQQLLDMLQALLRADQVGPRAELERLFARSDVEIAAHAGGQVDDHVSAGGADAVDHLGIELHVARALAGLRIAHVHVADGGAGLGGFDGGIGDLLRRHRNGGMLADRVAGAGDGAGHDDFGVHGMAPLSQLLGRCCVQAKMG
jgi:hypothetical protein